MEFGLIVQNPFLFIAIINITSQRASEGHYPKYSYESTSVGHIASHHITSVFSPSTIESAWSSATMSTSVVKMGMIFDM